MKIIFWFVSFLLFLFATPQAMASSFTVTNFTLNHSTGVYSFDYSGYSGGDISTESIAFGGNIEGPSATWQFNHEPANCSGGSSGSGTCSGTVNYFVKPSFNCSDPVWVRIYGYNENSADYITGLTNPDPSCSTSTIDLNVPIIKQTSLPWATQIYDSANIWSPSAQTIKSWGCALTSAAMVFKYYGYEKLPDGTPLNPGTLNDWLKNTPGGYIRNGLVNWLALSRLSKLAKDTNELSFNALEYKRVNGYDPNELTENLNNGYPEILGVPGHFVVAKGINGNTFNINDPYYDKYTLEDYENTFNSLGTYIPSSTDLSYIMLVVDENVNISFKNSNYEEKGDSFIQEPLDNDQGDGTSGQPVNMFYFPEPDNGTYNLELSSSSDQNYQLDVYFYDVDGNVKILNLNGFVSEFNDDSFEIDFDKLLSDNSSIIVLSNNFRFDLGVLLESGDIKNRGIYTSFISKLNNFEKAKNNKTKTNILNAMINEAKAQRGKGISEVAYQIITNDINSLKDTL
ncbi:MAG: hypothetical protein COU25_03850 [Candidatus Levybacteria bacterium CG10_big_fil_rev_8_21_14_0_10_35_13]|nr:MAG: hypothetical protein COU25_03850 [Candidatus Levybacteria bacterium CG10_big_fil_rev_8_21_14_0_10_35_13]